MKKLFITTALLLSLNSSLHANPRIRLDVIGVLLAAHGLQFSNELANRLLAYFNQAGSAQSIPDLDTNTLEEMAADLDANLGWPENSPEAIELIARDNENIRYRIEREEFERLRRLAPGLSGVLSRTWLIAPTTSIPVQASSQTLYLITQLLRDYSITGLLSTIRKQALTRIKNEAKELGCGELTKIIEQFESDFGKEPQKLAGCALTRDGYALFTDFESNPIPKHLLEKLRKFFERRSTPVTFSEHSPHRYAKDYAVMKEGKVIRAPDRLSKEESELIIQIADRVSLIIPGEMNSKFLITLTYFDDIGKAVNEQIELIKQVGRAKTKHVALPAFTWHQDNFDDRRVDYLFFSVLDTQGLSPHDLEVGQVHPSSLAPKNPEQPPHLEEGKKPTKTIKIPCKPGSGYLINQNWAGAEGNIILHSRSGYQAFLTSYSLTEALKEHPEHAPLLKKSESYWNDLSDPNSKKPCRKVVVIRLTKLTQ